MIREINGQEPHPSYGGWENFLKQCSIVDSFDGVLHYNSSNHNYIVFPDGTLLANFGFHGRNLMNRIRRDGAESTLRAIQQAHE